MPAAQTLRWGILGCGRIAETMAGAISATEGCVLRAVASRSVTKATAFAARTGAPLAFGDYAALAACADIDVVYVATPPSRHVEDCLLCLDHGRHVLCEKPFSTDAAGAARIVAHARERGLFVMEALWTRFLPSLRHAESMLHAGRIGTPQLLLAGGAFVPPPDPGYYLFREDLGGGAMRDAGVYLLHLANWLLGPPNSIAARCVRGEHGVDEQDGVLLGFAGGALALLHVSLRAVQRPGLELLGSAGVLRLLPPVFNPSAVEWQAHGGDGERREFASDASGYRHQIAEVRDCLRQGLLESPRLPLAQSVSVMECIDRILRAG